MAGFPTDDERAIDFGGHCYTDRVPFRPDHLGAFEDIVPGFSDPETLAARYREAGYDGAVLVAPGYAQETAERAARANDVLREVVESEDVFLDGLAAIPMLGDGEAAAAEFERCLDAGFCGGVVETRSDDGVGLTDGRFEPVWEVADRTGAPVLVHPRKMNLLADHNATDEVFGHELTLCDSLCQVIHEGVLDRYPDLTLVYDHFAGNVASQLGRLRYRLRPDRWPGEFDGKPWPEFVAQLEERIHVKMSGFSAHHVPLEAALEAFPSEHVLFGTDFPFEARSAGELRTYVDHVREHAPGPARRDILAGNARDLIA